MHLRHSFNFQFYDILFLFITYLIWSCEIQGVMKARLLQLGVACARNMCMELILGLTVYQANTTTCLVK